MKFIAYDILKVYPGSEGKTSKQKLSSDNGLLTVSPNIYPSEFQLGLVGLAKWQYCPSESVNGVPKLDGDIIVGTQVAEFEAYVEAFNQCKYTALGDYL